MTNSNRVLLVINFVHPLATVAPGCDGQ